MAADHLEGLLKTYDNEIEILAKISSVSKGIEWFKKNASPDLIFLDIDLGDGLSFEIIENLNLGTAIIFTTAYDEYAIKAFKVNSIDYLLKPIDLEELSAAINKYKNLSFQNISSQMMLENISDTINKLNKSFKNRFIVKVGEQIKWFSVDNISFFFSRDKSTYIHADDGRNYPIDYTVEQIEGMVNPEAFYRANRKYLLSIKCIERIITMSKNKIKIVLKNWDDQNVFVSRDRMKGFKSWLDK